MAAPAGKVPILQSATAGFAFMRAAVPTVWPAAALLAAAATALSAWAGDGGQAPGRVLLMLAGLAGLTTLYLAFLYRVALAPAPAAPAPGGTGGFLGLRLSDDETRLLGVRIAIGFLFFILAAVALIVVSFAAAAALAASGFNPDSLRGDPEAARAALAALFAGPQAPLFWALTLGVLALWLWLSARLILAEPATIAEGRMRAFTTFAWTSGNGWRITAALLLVVAPLTLGILAAGQVLAGLGGGMLALLSAFATAFAQYLLVLPAQAGLGAFLHKGLRPPTAGPPV